MARVVLNRAADGDFEIVGIAEPNRELAQRFLSRYGLSMDLVYPTIEEMMDGNRSHLVFDGEICAVDENGNEDFQKAVSEVKKKDKEMESPKFIIFDLIGGEGFRAGYSDTVYGVDRKSVV